MLTALQLIKEELKNARETFEGTIADVTSEQLHTDPGGKALPIGSLIAHVAFSDDMVVHGMLQGKPTLASTTWKGKTGVDKDMPAMDENWAKANEAWSKTVKVDLPKLKEFTKAVFSATDEYVNSLKDEDLEKEIDLGAWGKQTLAHMLYGFIIGHLNSIAGEISALKGTQGAKGYPF